MSNSPGENRKSRGENAGSGGERRDRLQRRLTRAPCRSPSLARNPFLARDVLKPIAEIESLSGRRVPW
jgi:hypothetical protein